MSAKKNANLILNQVEFGEFFAFLEENKITQQQLADIVSMSKSQTGVVLRSKKVPRAWREHLFLRYEVKDLKDKIKKIEDSLK